MCCLQLRSQCALGIGTSLCVTESEINMWPAKYSQGAVSWVKACLGMVRIELEDQYTSGYLRLKI